VGGNVVKKPPEKKQSVTSLYTQKREVFESDPTKIWTPKEIAIEIHAKPDAVKQALGRGSLPFIKIKYGLYQYSSDKGGKLHDLLLRSGKVGFENIVYIRKPVTIGDTVSHKSLHKTSQFPMESDASNPSLKSQPISRKGYPRKLITGQEIRWEYWGNGTEKVSFASNGRLFSLDLLLCLHKKMEEEGLTGEEWKRVSIELSIDGMSVRLEPECVTLQDTVGVLTKVYNHGMQARYEIADRREVPFKDSIEFLLKMQDGMLGREALKKVESLEKKLEANTGDTRLALNLARNAREKVSELLSRRSIRHKSKSYKKVVS
jgi:hypothetical protein